jgi:hypothetical protein
VNQADLTSEVGNLTGTKKEAQPAVDCVLDAVTRALIHRGNVREIWQGGGYREKSVLRLQSPINQQWDTRSVTSCRCEQSDGTAVEITGSEGRSETRSVSGLPHAQFARPDVPRASIAALS